MDFIVILIFFTVFFLIARRASKKQQTPVVLPPDFFGTHALPPDHVLQVGGVPAAVLPAPAGGEESSSELMFDEAAGDRELNLDAIAEEATRERPADGMSVAARPLPREPVSRETEVDWNAEHERFHKRYVDARPPSLAAAHGLLDELRDPAGARRAVLLAEILGPPISMRR